MKRYYTTAADGRVFEHPDGPFVLFAEHEAELADARNLLGLALNRISGEPGTINHDLNKRIADFLVLKREYRPNAPAPETK